MSSEPGYKQGTYPGRNVKTYPINRVHLYPGTSPEVAYFLGFSGLSKYMRFSHDRSRSGDYLIHMINEGVFIFTRVRKPLKILGFSPVITKMKPGTKGVQTSTLLLGSKENVPGTK